MESYENKVVLYLDILGFKNLILNTQKKNIKKKSIQLINNIYEVVINSFEETKYEKRFKSDISQVQHIWELQLLKNPYIQNKKISIFSDTIVITFASENVNHWMDFFNNINQLQVKLINLGVLCRGALTYGEVIHNENIIFGPAIVDAYELEGKYAKYPRIIVSDCIIQFLKKKFNCRIVQSYGESDANYSWEKEDEEDRLNPDLIRSQDSILYENFAEEILDDLILLDDDGYYFIDYFEDTLLNNSTSGHLYVDSFFNSLQKIIRKNKRIYKDNINILDKYLWLEKQYYYSLNTWKRIKNYHA